MMEQDVINLFNPWMGLRDDKLLSLFMHVIIIILIKRTNHIISENLIALYKSVQSWHIFDTIIFH